MDVGTDRMQVEARRKEEGWFSVSWEAKSSMEELQVQSHLFVTLFSSLSSSLLFLHMPLPPYLIPIKYFRVLSELLSPHLLGTLAVSIKGGNSVQQMFI